MLGEKQEGCIKLTEKSERTKSFCYLKQELLQDVPIFTSCPQLLLINSWPPSMEKSWKKWIQVAPIKDTCHCHAANQCLHGWQWRHHHVSIIPLKMGGDEKISTMQTGSSEEPSETEHGAISPACSSEVTKPILSNLVLTWLHSFTCHLHPVRQAHDTTPRLQRVLHAKRVGILSSGESRWALGITITTGKALTYGETRQVSRTKRQQYKQQCGGLTIKKGWTSYLSPVFCLECLKMPGREECQN